MNLIYFYLKRLVGMPVSVLCTRFVHWAKPLTFSLPLGTLADLARSKAERVRGKYPLTTTTDHAQAAGETASMHEGGSNAPCTLSTGCLGMEASALSRSTRDTAAASIVSSSACTGSAGQRPLLTSPS